MKKLTRLLSLILVVCSLASNLILPANAATSWPSLSSKSYCEFKAAKTINVYRNTSCTTPGTSSPAKSCNAYISKNDICYIYNITSSYIQVNYPTSSGRRTGYIKRSDLFSQSVPTKMTTSTGTATTYASAGGASYGSIAKGDKIYACGTSGSYTAVIYTAKSGSRAYKLGWLKTSDYNKYCETSIAIHPASVSLTKIGSQYDLSATVVNGSGSTTWSSSNKSVATVSSRGVVTAKGIGSCTITATNSGKVARCTVSVSPGSIYASADDVKQAAKIYGISTSSNAYKALDSIRTKYASSLSATEKKGVCVFMFEGVGSSSGTSKRQNAMCVVVVNGIVKYIDRNSSTLPDSPFTPSLNEGDAMPTLKSGIYSFTTTNHRGKYAALNVSNARVVRFSSRNSFYSSTSCGINVHAKSSNQARTSKWVNSAGCLLVGLAGSSGKLSSDYVNFCKAVGICNASSMTDSTKYSSYVSGKLIVDRTYAASYMKNIGYSSNAISLIG